jgi:hypothetical protein
MRSSARKLTWAVAGKRSNAWRLGAEKIAGRAASPISGICCNSAADCGLRLVQAVARRAVRRAVFLRRALQRAASPAARVRVRTRRNRFLSESRAGFFNGSLWSKCCVLFCVRWGMAGFDTARHAFVGCESFLPPACLLKRTNALSALPHACRDWLGNEVGGNCLPMSPP